MVFAGQVRRFKACFRSPNILKWTSLKPLVALQNKSRKRFPALSNSPTRARLCPSSQPLALGRLSQASTASFTKSYRPNAKWIYSPCGMGQGCGITSLDSFCRCDSATIMYETLQKCRKFFRACPAFSIEYIDFKQNLI